MRSIWNGTLGFGLVNIPVKIYSATEPRKVDLDMLDKRDYSRIRYKKVNSNTGEEVDWDDIVKGYRLEGGEYVILNDEDFEKVSVKKSKIIEIEEFVDKDEVADVLFKKPYFLEPQEGGQKSYALLKKALKDSNRVGVATFVMRQKEHLCLVETYENSIILQLIRFAQEVRSTEDLNLPEDVEIKEKEVDLAKNLIDQYATEFKLEKYSDVYNEKLLELIEAKAAGETPKAREEEVTTAETEDLMEQLRASLEQKKAS